MYPRQTLVDDIKIMDQMFKKHHENSKDGLLRTTNVIADLVDKFRIEFGHKYDDKLLKRFAMCRTMHRLKWVQNQIILAKHEESLRSKRKKLDYAYNVNPTPNTSQISDPTQSYETKTSPFNQKKKKQKAKNPPKKTKPKNPPKKTKPKNPPKKTKPKNPPKNKQNRPKVPPKKRKSDPTKVKPTKKTKQTKETPEKSKAPAKPKVPKTPKAPKPPKKIPNAPKKNPCNTLIKEKSTSGP